jgi:hypothetical protein
MAQRRLSGSGSEAPGSGAPETSLLVPAKNTKAIIIINSIVKDY